jgi:hypothetical protein
MNCYKKLIENLFFASRFAICPREMWGEEKEMEGIMRIEFREDYFNNQESKIEIYS